MADIKVLYVSNRCDVFSGGQISLLELLGGLDKKRFKPVLLCPGKGGMAERARGMGIDVRTWELPSVKSLGFRDIFVKAGELRRIARECKADIVHTNGSRAQFYASLALKSDIRLVWHVRESVKDAFIYDWFLSRSSDRLICVSKGVANDKFGRFPYLKPRIRVVYNGVDIERFKPDGTSRAMTRSRLGISDKEKVIGIVALLVPLKGHPIMFRAMRTIIKRYPGTRLLVVGKAVDREYEVRLRNMVNDMGIRNNIIFMGPSDDVNEVLSALDIFVLPSEREGCSRVILEAMACARSIVATNVSGNNELITDGLTGRLVPYGDSEATARTVMELMSDKNRADSMAAAARVRAETEFGIDKHVERIQKVYEDMW